MIPLPLPTYSQNFRTISATVLRNFVINKHTNKQTKQRYTNTGDRKQTPAPANLTNDSLACGQLGRTTVGQNFECCRQKPQHESALKCSSLMYDALFAAPVKSMHRPTDVTVVVSIAVNAQLLLCCFKRFYPTTSVLSVVDMFASKHLTTFTLCVFQHSSSVFKQKDALTMAEMTCLSRSEPASSLRP